MVLKQTINDGNTTTTRIIRNVKKSELSKYREGLYAARSYARKGELIQLIGNQRITIAKF